MKYLLAFVIVFLSGYAHCQIHIGGWHLGSDTFPVVDLQSDTLSYPTISGRVYYSIATDTKIKFDTSLFKIENDSVVYKIEPHLKAFKDDIPFWICIGVMGLMFCLLSLFFKWWDKYNI